MLRARPVPPSCIAITVHAAAALLPAATAARGRRSLDPFERGIFSPLATLGATACGLNSEQS